MPLKQCTVDGKRGWQYGSQHCFTGPDAKRQAIKQMIAIFGPDKFQKHLHEKAAIQDFGGRENLILAKAIFKEEYPHGYTDVFIYSIASYLSKSDDGQNDSDDDKGNMLDEKEDKACMATKVVENAGDLSGNPANTGDGSGNEFNKKGSASKDSYGEGPGNDNDGDEPDPQVKGSIDIKYPNRGPVGKDTFKNGDDNKVVKADPEDNNDQGLENDHKNVGVNIVVPRYNDDASPETNPAKTPKDGVYQTPPSRTETTPPNTDNRTTLNPKLQYKTHSEDDCKYGMDDEGDEKDIKAKGKTITNVPESEDIVKKTTIGNVYHDEDDEKDATVAESIWQTIAYISQKERDAVSDEDFAGPHRSFPIRNSMDVKHAAHLIGHGANPTAIKRKIIEIARRKGLELPESWKLPDEKSRAYHEVMEYLSKATPDEKKSLADKLDFKEMAVNGPEEGKEV